MRDLVKKISNNFPSSVYGGSAETLVEAMGARALARNNALTINKSSKRRKNVAPHFPHKWRKKL